MPTNDLTTDQTVISCMSNSISFMLGRGARATMREAGKEASHELWPDLPDNPSPEEMASIMKAGVANLKGFGEFDLMPQGDDQYKIDFKRCSFSQFTEKSGAPCGEQAICFFGFGLVEETLRRMTGKKMVVKLTQRDDDTETCHELAVPR